MRNRLSPSPSAKKVSFDDCLTPNRNAYLQSARKSPGRTRRHKIFGSKSKSYINQSPIITSKVSEMQKKIDQLTTTLFCREKRQMELEFKISKALNTKSQELIGLEKQILDMYEKLRMKDYEIKTLELEVQRASRCSRIIQQNRELEQNLQQSKMEHISKQSTKNSFVEGSGIVRNRKKTQTYNQKYSETSPSKFGVSLDNILSPFSLEENWK